jgi:hypothetical protein
MTRLRFALCAAILASVAVRLQAVPTVTIYDDPGSAVSSGLKNFSSGTIGGSSEAIWWSTTDNVGFGSTVGALTEPGSSQISDEYAVFALGPLGAYGVFISNPSALPSSISLPGVGSVNLSALLAGAGGNVTPETGGSQTIFSNGKLLVVDPPASLPDGGSTVALMGVGLLGLAGIGSLKVRSANIAK